jgi:hypothetical protein
MTLDRLRDPSSRTTLVPVTLHDWIDELCDALDIETEVDEGLILDLARDAAHNVERVAAPITTYLLGYAAAQHEANPERLEALAAAATLLAEKFGAAAAKEGSEDYETYDAPSDAV